MKLSNSCKNVFRGITLIVMVTVFISCNSTTKTNVLSEIELQKIPGSYDNVVTRIPQNDDYSCATTSLAMIISYYQKTTQLVDKTEIWNISETKIEAVKKYGNDINGLKKIANHYGYKYSFEQGMTYEKLEYYISKNIPVIIFINFDKNHTHATLVTGYNKQKKEYYVVDPSVTETVMPEAFLDKHWSAFLSNPRTESYRAGFVIFNK